jgi:DNA-binding CsgD family transcriptional regulator
LRRDASSLPPYRARARRLTPEQEATIRALAAIKSLRSLAAEFGISHETIRTVLRALRTMTDGKDDLGPVAEALSLDLGESRRDLR